MSRKLYKHLIETNSFGIKDKVQKETKTVKPSVQPNVTVASIY